ncbi:hypothetical protein [Pseudobacter ginsenosidimutans]|uniref:Uncharacterized protein n=1 Tax=Pseudobacter ginsenosidimutans TaxID=661488 RepID=A0A4Q7MVM3_9BACT|nr:hypothetical protein [Pseudobacter ginsenosidimutans]QEC42013.1 hypothetical protein FSB84_10060 [Pseudobacter ginsenosidimutans]RZS71153.1 hypothetical protein EV199_3054 [Pseudobacter ginsenosidimutans]
MNNGPDKKKEAPGQPNQKGKIELPGATSQPPKKEKDKKKDDDAGPIGRQDYGNPKNQSGKNTPPESED